MSHKSPDSHVNVKIEFGEGNEKVPLDAIAERAKKYQPKPKITYKMIQEYVEKKYGFKVEDICIYIPVALNFMLKHIGKCGKRKKVIQ